MCAKYIQYLLYLVTSLKSIVKGQMIQIELTNNGLEPFIKEKEGVKKALHLCKAVFKSGPTWARTKDPLIMSQML
jgi:hypothetical protein